MGLRLGATEVVLAVGGAVSDQTLDQLLKCQEAGIEVVTFARVYAADSAARYRSGSGPPLAFHQLFSGAGPRDSSPVAKRVLDVVVAVTLGVPGAVLGVLAAVAILLESGRPVFYSQMRQGRGGRLFRLTKFRTMGLDAEADGPRWSPRDDPRITRVGRVLRQTHVDELPNLWAVLRGHMSMVGPRPERPEFIASLEREVPLYRTRLTVAPGLTGWAQVNTEYGDSVEDATIKLEYDLYYVRHRSLGSTSASWRARGANAGLEGTLMPNTRRSPISGAHWLRRSSHSLCDGGVATLSAWTLNRSRIAQTHERARVAAGVCEAARMVSPRRYRLRPGACPIGTLNHRRSHGSLPGIAPRWLQGARVAPELFGSGMPTDAWGRCFLLNADALSSRGPVWLLSAGPNA